MKTIFGKTETRYILETTSGATSSAVVATAEKSLGELQRRETMSVPVNQKPRQGPLKPQTGGGKHRDKKKEQKLGKEKHRKPFAEGHDNLDHEISMASNELQSIAADAKKLLMLVKRYSEMEGLEAWQQSKITKAADYMTSVLRSIEGEQGVAEGLPQTLRKVVPGYAKREIDKKMDAGKFGKTDADKDANFQRYKKIQDKIKEQGVAEDDNSDVADISDSDYMRIKGIVDKKYPGYELSGLTLGRDGNIEVEIYNYETHDVKHLKTQSTSEKQQGVAEGSGPKEKQKTPYRDINSAEYRAAAEKQKQQMAKDKLAEPGKKLLAKKGVAEGSSNRLVPGKFYLLGKDKKVFTDPGAQTPGVPYEFDDSEEVLDFHKNMSMGEYDWFTPVKFDGNNFQNIEDVAEEKQKGVDGKACWKGYKRMGTKQKGSRTVDNCVKVGEEETNESGLLAWAGRKKHGADYMNKASAAARKGASQEELGRLKDKFSKAAKKEDTYMENLWAQLGNAVNEKAPEGAKYKRMAKHIKASYKGSGLDDEEIAQRAFGATWKAAKRAKK